MTIESYNLQFTMSQAENAQLFQNLHLLQAQAAAEEARAREEELLRARHTNVEETEETENPRIEEDLDRREPPHRKSRRERAGRSTEESPEAAEVSREVVADLTGKGGHVDISA